MIRTLLVANRGEIARRVFRTANLMGIRTVAVYSDPDAFSPHVTDADLAVALGGSTSADSYLNVDKILAAVRSSGADAVHPGYGFLSENAEFAARCTREGVLFVGPSPESMTEMGLKDRAKEIARSAGVPVLPDAVITGDGKDEWLAAAEAVGFPLLVKATAGGGGKGMRLVESPAGLIAAIMGARREAASSFGNATVFIERYLAKARHVEIQVFGDAHGNAIHLGERECSVQRRHQKVLEEAPSSAVSTQLRERMGQTAVALVQKLNYLGAGTVEFLLDDIRDEFFFLEMNTRLQVEHPVTEEVTGLDLVRMQLEVASGAPLALMQSEVRRNGHAIEVRLYAEDTTRDYLPTPGPLKRYSHVPLPGVRYEDGVSAPGEVSIYYDPMLAKIIAHASTRAEAAALLATALDMTQVHGTVTNRDMLSALLRDADFGAGATHTDFLDLHPELLEPTPSTPAVVHLAAAVAVTAAQRRDADKLAAFAPPGFRLLCASPPTSATWRSASGQAAMLTYRLDAAKGDASLELSIDGNAHQFQLRALSTDGVRVVHEGLERACAVSVYPDGSIWVNDVASQSNWSREPRLPEPQAAIAAGGLVAALPGTVVAVFVEKGDRVVAGQQLVVMEAMKMEHPTMATSDGIVEAVHVKVGQSIQAGAVLLTISNGGTVRDND
jgi:propionyl-CoA carboxylase alpha chain